jgi:hypothetical protein
MPTGFIHFTNQASVVGFWPRRTSSCVRTSNPHRALSDDFASRSVSYFVLLSRTLVDMLR